MTIFFIMIKVFHKAVFFPRFLLLNLYLNELPYNLNNNAKDGEAGKNILTAGIVKSYGEERKQQVKYTFFYYSL